MYRKNVVSAARGKSPQNFMKLYFQVCSMNRLGEKMVQLILKILGQTEHPIRYRNEESEDPGKFFVFSQAHKAP